MSNIKKTSLLILATWLMTSCGGEIGSNVLGDAGLLSTGLNTMDDSGVELDDSLQGVSQSADDADYDESNVDGADLVGSSALPTASLPVTMSKGDPTTPGEEAIPPSDEDCNADTQGSVYITATAASAASLGRSAQTQSMAFLARVFKNALAEVEDVVFVRTTIAQLVLTEDYWSIFEAADTEFYQCQVTLPEDGESEEYGWVLLDKEVALGAFTDIYDYLLEENKASGAPKATSPNTLEFDRVVKPVQKFEGLQPRYTIKVNAFTGKKAAFVQKSFKSLNE